MLPVATTKRNSSHDAIATLNELLLRAKTLEERITTTRDKYVFPHKSDEDNRRAMTPSPRNSSPSQSKSNLSLRLSSKLRSPTTRSLSMSPRPESTSPLSSRSRGATS
jgi:hypothetical protein